MERLSDMNPCNICTVDRQVGNPYTWQCECERCLRPSQWKDKCVNKLWQYERLQEQGRLLELPCAVGDTVFEIDEFEKEITKRKVYSIEIDDYGVTVMVSEPYGCSPYTGRTIDDFGETIFLSKEEAEKTLREIKNE